MSIDMQDMRVDFSDHSLNEYEWTRFDKNQPSLSQDGQLITIEVRSSSDRLTNMAEAFLNFSFTLTKAAADGDGNYS